MQKADYDNPYLQAKAEWFESVGPHVASAAHWRLTAVVALLLACVSATGNVIQASREKVAPYVVAVDKIGAALAVQRADRASPVPLALVQAELANLVTNWRTVTADLDLQGRMLERLSGFVRGAAKGVLTEYFEGANPVAIAKKGRLISVEIKTVPLPVSRDSWRVEWQETTRNHAGLAMEVARYEATMTVSLQPPTTDAEILRNPGGVYATELSFGKILSRSQESEAAK